MKIAILANDLLKRELALKGLPPAVEVLWADTFETLLVTNADVYMDLLFIKENDRVDNLANLLPKPVFVNEVTYTLAELGWPFIRLNAWPGFLQRQLIEIAVPNKQVEDIAREVLSFLEWRYQLVPDIAGMISARVVAMIINEAYFALGEGLSTKPQIDTAMKLGTNYPHGPFEWCEIIGLENIFKLLSRLGEEGERYAIAETLSNELNKLT